MRVSELSGALLDYWTARAEGVPADQLEIRDAQRPDDPHAPKQFCVRRLPYRDPIIGPDEVRMQYSTNWHQGGPLLEKHQIDITNCVDPVRCEATIFRVDIAFGEGDTPLIAICRAVVRAAFGDEVEDLPCA